MRPGRHRPAERQLIRPILDVDIATHREYRRELTQAREDLRPADIAGVNDKLSAGKRIQSFCAQQAVSIGDNTDERCLGSRVASPGAHKQVTRKESKADAVLTAAL